MSVSTDAEDAGDGASAVAADGGAPPSESPSVEIATTSTPCSAEGARACTGRGSRDVLICEQSIWKLHESCRDAERCDANGKCRPVATECIGRKTGDRFCDASYVMLECQDDGSAEESPCGPQQHCVMKDKQPICACKSGFLDMGSGCEIAMNCDAQGGCDPMTVCSMDGATRRCSACPPGYQGDGLTGCTPQLTNLTLSCGRFVSEPNGATTEYRVETSSLCQRIELGFQIPEQAQLEIDGTQALGTSWKSDPIPLGETTIPMNLTSRSGARQYTLVVKRSGEHDAYVKSSNPGSGDGFGVHSAAFGDSFIAGAPYEDSGASGVDGDQSSNSAANSGAAYVFARRGEAWFQEAYLKADAPSDGDYFGVSVALSEDIAVVGAPGQDVVRFNSVTPTRTGSAYVYTRRDGVWSFEQKLEPKTRASAADLFGFKVAIQGDTILVTDPEDDVGASRSGAIYVFTRGVDGWTERQRLKAAQPIRDSTLGFSVAIDGDTIVSGAAVDSTGATNSGSAHVFVLRGGAWQEQRRLRAERVEARAVFGWQVAVRGDTAAITAPGVDLVMRSGTSGKVYTFERTDGEWEQSAVFAAPVPRADDYFGSGVALSESTLLIGGNAENSGSRGPGGDPARLDAPYSGAAYLYTRQGSGWAQTAYLKAPNSDPSDGFGVSVALAEKFAVITVPFEDGASAGFNGDLSSNSVENTGALFVYR